MPETVRPPQFPVAGAAAQRRTQAVDGGAAPRFSDLLRQRLCGPGRAPEDATDEAGESQLPQRSEEPAESEASAAAPEPSKQSGGDGTAVHDQPHGQPSVDRRPSQDQSTLPGAAGAARPAEVQWQAPTGGAHDRLKRLADTVASLCNDSAVIDSDGWRVRVPLRSDVLPDSTLDMSASPHWIRMRFAIGDADARQLVCRHSDDLVNMLQAALKRPREVSITVD